MFGFLNLHKPADMTSRDVVNRVQRLVRPIKVGHAGTLDPLATGVLVVALGPATRLIEYVQAQRKVYRAVFRLGQSSNTEDLEGEITCLTNPPRPQRSEIEAVLPSFVGEIQQVPPAYSAVKIAGQRAYQLARRGTDVELAARTIRIDSLQMVGYDYPNLELVIGCGGGTYVRSLGRDIARALGTEALMASLVRTDIGGFTLESALPVNSLTLDAIKDSLMEPSKALAEHPTVQIDADQLRTLQNGRPLQLDSESGFDLDLPHRLVFDQQQRLQAIVRPTEKGWRVAKSFWDAHGTPPLRQATQ